MLWYSSPTTTRQDHQLEPSNKSVQPTRLRRAADLNRYSALPMTLAELTEEEGRLRTQFGLVTGSMEEKQAQSERLGVLDDYARVHAAYANPAAGGDPEALKRALFPPPPRCR